MDSWMRREICEIPDRLADLTQNHRLQFVELAVELRRKSPVFAGTVARGSSDHVASYAAHLFATINGIATATLPPSLATLFDAKPSLARSFVLAISQSGGSPDLAAMMQLAKRSGALTAGLINQDGSPLESEVEWRLPQAAGSERAVAATKSVVGSLAAVALLAALWAQDGELERAVLTLGDAIRDTAIFEPFDIGQSIFVVGRGAGLGIAGEIALKFQETCGVPAQAYSSAEIEHGPKAALTPGSTVIALETDDPGGHSVRRWREAGGAERYRWVTVSANDNASVRLPTPLHPQLDAIVALASIYPRIEATAIARGLDPDQPHGLKKVTQTL